MALSELNAYLESFGLRNTPVLYADRIDGDLLKTNLILLGGPDANLISKEAVARIKSTIRSGDPNLYEISIYDSIADISCSPSYNSSGEIITDCGLIIKTSNPFALNKQILLLYGSFGYGTLAAVRFTQSDQFLREENVATGKSIECLIETDIVRGTPQEIRVRALRRLNTSVGPQK